MATTTMLHSWSLATQLTVLMAVVIAAVVAVLLLAA